MILDVFLPEKFGSRRLLSKRTLSLFCRDDGAYLALANAKPSSTTIELISSETAPSGDMDALSAAIRKLVEQVKKFDKIIVSIPASIVIFKEIEVPFVDTDKIRMVLDYEVEPMLPFSLEDAVTDFMVLDKNLSENKARVLVAAVRAEDLQGNLDIYLKAGVEPDIVTVDTFAIYSLYSQIPEYKAIEHSSAIVDVGIKTTEITFLEGGHIRLSRHIQKGVSTIVKHVSDDCGLSIEEVQEKLKTIGVSEGEDDGDVSKFLQNHLIDFFHDIQFTLNSFSLKLNYYGVMKKILFTGRHSEVNGMIVFGENVLQSPCESFGIEKLFKNPLIKDNSKSDQISSPDFIVPLGAAVPNDDQYDFNLRKKQFMPSSDRLLNKQLFFVAALVLFLFAFIGTNGYMQISALSSQIKSIETDQVKRLIGIFPRKIRPKNPKFQALMKKAEDMLKEKKSALAPFSGDRIKPIEIMLEVTNLMDIRRFDINIGYFSIVEKEPGNPIVEVDGQLLSKRGIGHHYEDWAELEGRLRASNLIALVDQPTTMAEGEKGIKFSAKFKKLEGK
jgi:type IV pilus assembly protein PilM